MDDRYVNLFHIPAAGMRGTTVLAKFNYILEKVKAFSDTLKSLVILNPTFVRSFFQKYKLVSWSEEVGSKSKGPGFDSSES